MLNWQFSSVKIRIALCIAPEERLAYQNSHVGYRDFLETIVTEIRYHRDDSRSVHIYRRENYSILVEAIDIQELGQISKLRTRLFKS